MPAGLSRTLAAKAGAIPSASTAAPLGRITEGAWADVLLVEGDPTQDLTVPGDPDTNLAVIIEDGRIYKNLLG
ncbi:hypothetical protein TR51_01670 [Kitasatospora griseola]|uniref:Amidohydrolase-related domain-containing protein n=1 Tax=Kitasatospora griseola TaxID=2064 RepID=A0A0D0Q1E8_KITGR|nr:hypothetical protein [Kitasatospora griseola]KIQ66367.1 hypothetical protein TR51_01670 [Kitasatospora griseola]